MGGGKEMSAIAVGPISAVCHVGNREPICRHVTSLG